MPSDHLEITRSALNDPSVMLAECKDTYQTQRACTSAIEEITAANANADTPCPLGGEFCLSLAHCDNEVLNACAKRMDDERMRAKGFLTSGTPEGDKARQSLGKALHTIQDFYSHSNWVNNPGLNNAKAYPDLGRFQSFPNGIVAESQEITCTTGTDLIQFGLTKLLTGYYPKNPTGKCAHGKACNFIYTPRDGIHKDCSGRKFYDIAKKVAEEATKDYLRLFIQKDLNEDTNAVRKLFGLQ